MELLLFLFLSFLTAGPGGIHSLESYGTLLLVAGGIGITHPMSYLNEVVKNFAARKSATRKVHLVWMIRSLGMCFNPL